MCSEAVAHRLGRARTVEVLACRPRPDPRAGDSAAGRGRSSSGGRCADRAGEPDKTAEAIVDGWLHAGDIGYLHDEGYLYLTDRKRDIIISGGYNIYPSEVEQVVWSHPAVGDCAVIGVPHADWGEMMMAVMELSPGHSVSENELIEWAKTRLGSVRSPKRIDIVEQLPRSGTGKVLKRVVREPYWADSGRRI